MSRELIVAAMKGDNVAVKKLLEEGADQNYREAGFYMGWSPLMWGARNGHLEVATTLLDFYADMNPGEPHPVHLAMLGGHGDLVKLFISRGIGVNDLLDGEDILTTLATLAFDKNYIPGASFRNNTEDTSVATAEYLLKAGADINRVTERGTALMRSAFSEQLELVDLFCRQPNIRFDIIDTYGATALIEAIKGGSLEIVQTLVAHDPNINFVPPVVPTRPFVTGPAICHAVGSLKIEEELGDKWQIIQHLFSLGADINLFDSKEQSALLLCARSGFVKLFKQLLSLGANVEHKDREGFGVSDLANQPERYNAEITTVAGSAMLLFAKIRAGDLTEASCAMLLKLGANLNQRTKTGNTPLHLACVNGQVTVVRALLANIAKLSTKDQIAHLTSRNNAGHTPLDVVVSRNSNSDYIVVRAETDRLLAKILLNAIQRFINLVVFKIKKSPKMEHLPLDPIADIIDLNLPKFGVTPGGIVMLTQAIIKATNSSVINQLAIHYQKQNVKQKSERSVNVKTELDVKSIADLKKDSKCASHKFNQAANAGTSATVDTKHQSEILMSYNGALPFTPQIKMNTKSYGSAGAPAIDARAEIDYVTEQFAQKIKNFENEGKKASAELHAAFAKLQSAAVLAKVFIGSANANVTSTLSTAAPWKDFKKALQKVVELYEAALCPSKMLVLSF